MRKASALILGKVEPFLAQVREMMGSPDFLKNLEKVCYDAPGGKERVAATRERIRGMLASRAAGAKA